LIKLLFHLNALNNQQVWAQFLNPQGAPAGCASDGSLTNTGAQMHWDKITIVGHSQGGGHAALIGQRYSVQRVIALSSPTDTDKYTMPGTTMHAVWIEMQKATPSSRYFSLYHESEDAVTSDNVPRNLRALGLLSDGDAGTAFGPPLNIDFMEPPFGDTHVLTTNLLPKSGNCNDDTHKSTGGDEYAPQSNGIPLLLHAWNHLLDPSLDP
jgi:pimeloyl-ACP methyl ester carboxylesterase